MPNSTVDLTNCDREPIHIPGSIQSHGALLSFDSSLNTLKRCSANVGEILGIAVQSELGGASCESIFGDDLTHTFRNALANSNSTRRPALLFSVRFADRALDVSLHRAAGEAIVELEPIKSGAAQQPLDTVRNVISRIGRATTIDELVKETSRLIRATLGYDRVMIYKFEEDGAGQVISESKSGHLESFMGQYFPASDIPQQARSLYLKNTIRIISDASDARIPIVPELDAHGKPLDLSLAHLRSVSPIHCEYLRNMGVAASMSISIVIDGRLWGLIACHHYSPKRLDMAERVATEMFGEFFSLHLDVIRQKAKIDTAAAARYSLDQFLEEAPRRSDIIDLLKQTLPKFYAMMPSDGIGLWVNGKWTAFGVTPPSECIEALAGYVNKLSDSRLWATHKLSDTFPEASAYCAAASGVLAIPLSQRSRDYLFFFRKEFEHTLNWAGNPNKSYDTGPLGDRLTPRKSFAIWKEAVKGQSRRWTDTDHQTGEAIRSALVEIVLRHNELIVEERGKADLRQRMLNEELNHRVKNILAVIKSLVGQPNPKERTLDEYMTILRGRIEALAIAHDQIARGDGGGFLKDLLAAELKPYRDQAVEISLNGPAVWIDTTAFSVLALVFHEMSTNSAKYGALSRGSGKLTVSWAINGEHACEMTWQEDGGPDVEAPKRRGFGSILITRSIPHDLGGESHLDYRKEGLIARFVIPADHIALAEAQAAHTNDDSGANSANNRKIRAMDEITVLLVEDQMLIAMDAEMMLSDHGLTNVVTVSSAAEALRKLKTFKPMAAVLDVNLGVGTSLPIAEELRRQGVPFIFATGYGDSSIIPEDFADVRVVRKPYSDKDLMPAILNLLED
jgi:light-regulated signal transduction histidine kinase (bacteriophytochrome)